MTKPVTFWFVLLMLQRLIGFQHVNQLSMNNPSNYLLRKKLSGRVED